MAPADQDPRQEVFHQLRHAIQTSAAPALRSRRDSASQQERELLQPFPPQEEAPPPPRIHSHRTDSAMATRRTSDGRSRDGRAAAAAAVAAAYDDDGDDDRKYADPTDAPIHHVSDVPRKDQQSHKATNATELREHQRRRQVELARRMNTTSTAAASIASSTTSVAAQYHEMVSPVRPIGIAMAGVLASNGRGYTSNENQSHGDDSVTFHRHPPPSKRSTSRREPLSSVMQQFDDELSRSASDHERPSIALSRDAGEMADDDENEGDGDDDNHHPTTHSMPPPSSSTDVSNGHQHQHQQQNGFPPFREELSSDVSDHVSPAAAHGTRVTTISEEMAAHFPVSSDFESIPSISLTPPATPKHQRPQPQQQQQQQQPQQTTDDSQVAQPASPLPGSWWMGLFGGCVVAGLSGTVLEMLMDLLGPSPYTFSPAVQRETNRRWDLLQQELQRLRAAADKIELQSQQLVETLRLHLDQMASERARHQRVVSLEMNALRGFVDRTRSELVEDEKQLIRQRLLDTIADTLAVETPLQEEPAMIMKTTVDEELVDDSERTAPPRSHESEVHDANRPTEEPEEEQEDEQVQDSKIEPVETPTTSSRVVEMGIAAVGDDVATFLLESVDEEAVMQQIDEALASVLSPSSLPSHAVEVETTTWTQTDTVNISVATTEVSRGSSPLSWELVVLLAGVAFVAAAVGARVRQAKRRQNAGTRKWHLRRQHIAKSAAVSSSLSDDSEVETVEFFRSGSESGFDGRLVEEEKKDEEEDDAGEGEEEEEEDEMSVYSEESKDEEDDERDGDGRYEQESVAMSSEDGDYDFQPAQLSGDNSDIEQLDESPSSASPFTRKQQHHQQPQHNDRVTDDTSVRRNPRIQSRSNLSYMR